MRFLVAGVIICIVVASGSSEFDGMMGKSVEERLADYATEQAEHRVGLIEEDHPRGVNTMEAAQRTFGGMYHEQVPEEEEAPTPIMEFSQEWSDDDDETSDSPIVQEVLAAAKEKASSKKATRMSKAAHNRVWKSLEKSSNKAKPKAKAVSKSWSSDKAKATAARTAMVAGAKAKAAPVSKKNTPASWSSDKAKATAARTAKGDRANDSVFNKLKPMIIAHDRWAKGKHAVEAQAAPVSKKNTPASWSSDKAKATAARTAKVAGAKAKAAPVSKKNTPASWSSDKAKAAAASAARAKAKAAPVSKKNTPASWSSDKAKATAARAEKHLSKAAHDNVWKSLTSGASHDKAKATAARAAKVVVAKAKAAVKEIVSVTKFEMKLPITKAEWHKKKSSIEAAIAKKLHVSASEVTAHQGEVEPVGDSVWTGLMGKDDEKTDLVETEARSFQAALQNANRGMAIDFSVKEKRKVKSPAAAKADKIEERGEQKDMEAALKAMAHGGVEIDGIKVPKQNILKSIKEVNGGHVVKKARKPKKVKKVVKAPKMKPTPKAVKVFKKLTANRTTRRLHAKLRSANRTIRRLRSKLAQANKEKSVQIKDPSIKNAFRSTRKSLRRLSDVLKGGTGDEDEESNSDAASEAADEEEAEPVEATAVPVHHSKPSKPTPPSKLPWYEHAGPATDDEAEGDEADKEAKEHHSKPTPPSKPFFVATREHPMKRDPTAPSEVLKEMADGTYMPEDLEDDAALMEVEDQMVEEF